MAFRILLSTSFILYVGLLPSVAQCDQNCIESAEGNYQIGKFDLAREILRPCMPSTKNGISGFQIEARRLMALMAIAEDNLEEARQHIEQIYLAQPDFEPINQLIFDVLLRETADKHQIISVSSVSKRSEDIHLAPASVVLISREEILERGYMDLVELLSDLPGFDISKTYSINYANIYQLGFRQENTERTLLLVDGVEENDVWSNVAYLSRQYPLSNIKAVEIIYGPSSTIYGPRAFIGAINILTLDAGERAKPFFKNEKTEIPEKQEPPFYLLGNLQGGSLYTSDVDITIGFTKPNFQFSLSGRIYASRENKPTYVEFFDYAPDDIDSLDYSHLNLRGKVPFGKTDNGIRLIDLNQYADTFKLSSNSPLYTLYKNPLGRIDSIILTPAGIERARQIDRQTYTGEVNGFPSTYSNESREAFLGLKIGFGNFELGIRTWSIKGGFNYYQDIYTAGSRNGSVWIPKSTTFYAQYNKSFGKYYFSNLSSFSITGLDNETCQVSYSLLGTSTSALHLAHLLYPDSLITNSLGTDLSKTGYRNTFYFYQGQLFRNDTRFYYDYQNLTLSSGIEFRSGQLPGDYLRYITYDTLSPNKRKRISAQDLGRANNQEIGGNLYTTFDFGFYTQATYRFLEKRLQLTTGARFDYNRLRFNNGFGAKLTPRIAVVYNVPAITLKAFYSRGLQNVSQWAKYSTGGSRIPNPHLDVEKISYLELAASKAMLNQQLSFDMQLFLYEITNAVALVDTLASFQNRNVGLYEISGVLLSAAYRTVDRKWSAFLNYTIMSPYQIALKGVPAADYKLIGDIAPHRLNAGLSRRISFGSILSSLHLRANYVSNRPEGPETTQFFNTGLNHSNQIPAYLVFNGAASVGLKSLPGWRLSLKLDNLLNRNILSADDPHYYHPGPRLANGSYQVSNGFIPYMPQRNRFFTLELSAEF